jgi:hypothetical protein
LLGLAALALLAAGCGHSQSSPGNPTGGHGDGTIAGRFRIVGGPAPGIDRPLSGRIDVHAGAATGKVVAVTSTTSSGAFSVSVSAGRYVLVGLTGHSTGASCTSGLPTTVAAGQTARAIVQCDVP